VDDSPARRPRADSLRNREQLLEAARVAFADEGPDAALEAIARRAGVGIGTLYRHFPTRHALLAAVYQRAVEQLSASAERLLVERPADEALEAWLHLLVDYMATKRVVTPALRAASEEAPAGPDINGALERLTRAAVAQGRIRDGLGADDLYRMIVGLAHGYDQPGWEDSARRLIGVLVDGLRAR
jgi:AcrR family transcriptional regulator